LPENEKYKKFLRRGDGEKLKLDQQRTKSVEVLKRVSSESPLKKKEK